MRPSSPTLTLTRRRRRDSTRSPIVAAPPASRRASSSATAVPTSPSSTRSSCTTTILGRHANFRFETRDEDHQTRDTILRRAGRRIMVVPEGSAAAGPAVLIAYDGSMASRRALLSFALAKTDVPLYLHY